MIWLSQVQFSSVAQSCPTLCDPMNLSTPGPLSITVSWSSLRLTSIELVMPSSHLILCHPLLLLPPIPPSIRVFSSQSTLRMRWPKYWSFSFSIIPCNEHPGLISFRTDWLDLLAVQGTLKSLLQLHRDKFLYSGPSQTLPYVSLHLAICVLYCILYYIIKLVHISSCFPEFHELF